MGGFQRIQGYYLYQMCCKRPVKSSDLCLVWCDEYDERMTNAGVSTFKFHMLCYGMDWHGLGHNAHFILCQTSNLVIMKEYIYTEDEEIIQRHYTR